MKKKAYKIHAGRRRLSRRWIWAIAGSIIGLIIIVVAVAGGYYLWLNAKVSAANKRVTEDVRQALAQHPSTTVGKNGASTPPSPGAMNILVVGSDARDVDTEGSRSDTVILVHVDPANNYLSMLSLPRDLRVEVPGYGTRKLNFAFAFGGPALTIRTIEQITGLDVNHYLEVDFAAFGTMVTKLGGVYMEVDRPYYYMGSLYKHIDLQPGYQLLDGYAALDYVRYRHDLNADFGRMERQQRFINAARQQLMGWDLGVKLPGLVGTFFDNVTTDLKTNDFLRLAWWGIKLNGDRIRQVSLRGDNVLTQGVTLVVWKPQDMANAVQQLLTPPGAAPVKVGAAASAQATTTTTQAAPVLPVGATPQSITDSKVWPIVAKLVSFQVEAPSYIPDQYRLSGRRKTFAYVYNIKVGSSEKPAMIMLYQNTHYMHTGQVKYADEYLNVSATTWLDAPAAAPGHQVTYNGTVYTVVSTAGRVERIWWKSNGVLYWVGNTLSRVASETQLLAMAESMIPIPAQ